MRGPGGAAWLALAACCCCSCWWCPGGEALPRPQEALWGRPACVEERAQCAAQDAPTSTLLLGKGESDGGGYGNLRAPRCAAAAAAKKPFTQRSLDGGGGGFGFGKGFMHRSLHPDYLRRVNALDHPRKWAGRGDLASPSPPQVLGYGSEQL